MAQPPLLREGGEYACPNRFSLFGQHCLYQEGSLRTGTISFVICTALTFTKEGNPLSPNCSPNLDSSASRRRDSVLPQPDAFGQSPACKHLLHAGGADDDLMSDRNHHSFRLEAGGTQHCQRCFDGRNEPIGCVAIEAALNKPQQREIRLIQFR